MDNKFLYEAVYIFDKYCFVEDVESNNCNVTSKLSDNILTAMLRILAYGGLVTYRNNKFFVTSDDLKAINNMKETLDYIKKSNNMSELVDRIEMNKTGGFFKKLSDLEYEIYSRCNFPISYDMGLAINKLCDFDNGNILDLGGNSGGLASGIAGNNLDCKLTVVDQDIPCNVGKEIKAEYKVKNLKFVKGDFFTVDLKKTYDYIILSNILHDYDDESCRKVLRTCKKHSHSNTKILIVEDILNYETKPACVLEHGLRLSINTFEGRQRTVKELEILLDEISFTMDSKKAINDVQSMIVFKR